MEDASDMFLPCWEGVFPAATEIIILLQFNATSNYKNLVYLQTPTEWSILFEKKNETKRTAQKTCSDTFSCKEIGARKLYLRWNT